MPWLMFDSQWTCDGKNSPEFKRAVAVMHGRPPWMLGEEEGLSGDLTVIAQGGGAMDAARR
jgi:hypothetical protein